MTTFDTRTFSQRSADNPGPGLCLPGWEVPPLRAQRHINTQKEEEKKKTEGKKKGAEQKGKKSTRTRCKRHHTDLRIQSSQGTLSFFFWRPHYIVCLSSFLFSNVPSPFPSPFHSCLKEPKHSTDLGYGVHRFLGRLNSGGHIRDPFGDIRDPFGDIGDPLGDIGEPAKRLVSRVQG